MKPSRIVGIALAACLALAAGLGIALWAKQNPVTFVDENPAIEPIEPEMVEIPEGPFLMGGDAGLPTDGPPREVWLSAYRIGKYEVTCEEYLRFCEATDRPCPRDPDGFSPVGTASLAELRPDLAGYCRKFPRHPVIEISWTDAAAYAAWLSARTGKDYHLPTEAQWEKAARGGLVGQPYPWGDARDPGLAHMGKEWTTGPVQVGSFPPNGYGLHDVAGNVAEFTQDWFHETYPRWGPDRDPTGPTGLQAYLALLDPKSRSRLKGRCRSARGGSYRGGWDYGDFLTLGTKGKDENPPFVFARGWVYQEPYTHFDLGFRLAEGGVWR